jgi:acetyl-CoA carboxylase carboxyl transferase subunit alpha
MYADDHSLIWACAAGGAASRGDRSPEGPRHEGAVSTELRHGQRPEGYRKALRVMRLAEKFSLPLDHADRHEGRLSWRRRRGARPERGDRAQPVRDVRAAHADRQRRDRRGRFGRRARDRRRGQGDMLQYSIYSVISPEGCASILWKTAEKAEAPPKRWASPPTGCRSSAGRRGDCGAARRRAP